ncbi:MAG: hypothetical protein HYX35_07105 [Proteobacteria bacterium]|nr:hypothetical protein [Pseudomonadota bacterium]
MKITISLLFSFFLTTACYGVCTPNHSLKKAWTLELEKTQPSHLPYGLIYDLGSQKVIYVAMDANRTKSNALLESLIKDEKPQVILLQGHEGKTVSPSKVKFKLKNNKIVLKGASASREKILENLVPYGINEKDYESYKVLSLMNQIWYFEVDSPDKLKAKANHYLKTDPYAKKLLLTFDDIERWFQEKMGRPFTMEVVLNSENFAPKNPQLKSTTYLQKMSSYEDEIEDAVVMDNLAKALEEYKTVMIVRAGSKYVVERDVLHTMLGVSKPTKIVN